MENNSNIYGKLKIILTSKVNFQKKNIYIHFLEGETIHYSLSLNLARRIPALPLTDGFLMLLTILHTPH